MLLYLTGFILLGVSIYFFYESFSYMVIDENGQLDKKFVGGDAYNYIISGTYSTTIMLRSLLFAVLGSVFLLMGKMK